MRTVRMTATTWLSAVAAAIALSIAGAPAIADIGHGPTKSAAEKATPMHEMAAPPHGEKRDHEATADVGQEIAMADAPLALLMPLMNPARGRKVFAAKGCVVCHAINGVGGEHGPSLDMTTRGVMNPFEFAAKMWEGAESMIALQEEELGERISLSGQDLADMTAFVHSATEIRNFSAEDVPTRIMNIIQDGHGETQGH